MSVYLIALRESPVRDTEAMAEYQRITRENTGDFKLKPLAVYGAMEEARAWYQSPAYQAAIPYRQQAADYRVIFVEGL
jgi:hypothetical protein